MTLNDRELGILPQGACGVWLWYSHGRQPLKWSGKTGDETYPSVSTSDRFVHGFAALKDGACLLYLINKTNKAQPVHIQLQGVSRPSAFGRLMRDTEDHYGEMAPLGVRGSGSSFDATLPSLTFCEIGLIHGNANPFSNP